MRIENVSAASSSGGITRSCQQWLLFALLIGFIGLAPKSSLTTVVDHNGLAQVIENLQSNDVGIVSARVIPGSFERADFYHSRDNDRDWGYLSRSASSANTLLDAAKQDSLPGITLANPRSIDTRPYSPRSPPQIS